MSEGDLDALSHHSNIEERQESKCLNCLKVLLTIECGNIISLLNIILSAACVIIYIYTDYQPNVVLINSNIFFIINFSSRCFFFIILIFDIILGKYGFSTSKLTALIFDSLSTIPYLLSRISVGMTENLKSETHLITSSFVCFRLFEVISLSKFIHTDALREFFSILSFIICLIFNFTIIVNVIENTQTIGKYYLFLPRDCNNLYFCGGSNDSLHSTLFFIMTTIGIVGYNSNLISILGKVIMCVIIMLGLYEIVTKLSKLISLVSQKMAYARATYKIRDGIKFILICGNISVLTLSVLLKEYFHEDHGKEEKHCLILMPQNPDNDMEELLKLYKTNLFYLEGDPLKLKDLERCRFKQADKIMILCNKQAADSDAEDNKIIFMAMTIKNYFLMGKENQEEKSNLLLNTNRIMRVKTFRNMNSIRSIFSRSDGKEGGNVQSSKLIIQLLRPESIKNYNLLISGRNSEDEQIVCIDQLKISLLAKSCLCKGIISLISNLIITNNFDEEVEEQIGKLEWLEEYKNGKDYEIYKIPLDCLKGYNFDTVADKIYNEKHIIIFGLNIEDKESKKNTVLLSPMNFILPVSKELNIYGYLLAKDQDEATEVENWAKTIKKHIFFNEEKRDIFKRNFSKETEFNEDIKKEERSRKRTLRRTTTILNRQELSKFCHVLDEQVFLNNRTIDSVQDIPSLKDHIIICGICHNMIDLIKPLRSKNFPKHILPTIVILSKELPDLKLWNTIGYFENIYLIKGDGIEQSDLKRAKIKTAKYAILLAPSINEISNYTEFQRLKYRDNMNSSDENNENSGRKNLSKEEEYLLDSQTILKYNQISSINKDIFCVVELIDPNNVLFLNNKNRRNNDEYVFIQSGLSIDATASFATGEVYYSSIMDNITTQAYYNPSLLSVVKKLIISEDSQSNSVIENSINKYSSIPSGSLYLIDLPISLFLKEDEFNKDDHISFSKVFNILLQKKMIVIGVYRYGSLVKKRDEEPENILINNLNDSYFYYVVTAPEMSFKVSGKDKLFVISPDYPQFDHFEESKRSNYIISGKNLNLLEYNKNTSNIKNIRINKKEAQGDEQFELKLINFNNKLEKISNIIDDIDNCVNEITSESNDYIRDAIRKKLNGIKNKSKKVFK